MSSMSGSGSSHTMQVFSSSKKGSMFAGFQYSNFVICCSYTLLSSLKHTDKRVNNNNQCWEVGKHRVDKTPRFLKGRGDGNK